MMGLFKKEDLPLSQAYSMTWRRELSGKVKKEIERLEGVEAFASSLENGYDPAVASLTVKEATMWRKQLESFNYIFSDINAHMILELDGCAVPIDDQVRFLSLKPNAAKEFRLTVWTESENMDIRKFIRSIRDMVGDTGKGFFSDIVIEEAAVPDECDYESGLLEWDSQINKRKFEKEFIPRCIEEAYADGFYIACTSDPESEITAGRQRIPEDAEIIPVTDNNTITMCIDDHMCNVPDTEKQFWVFADIEQVFEILINSYLQTVILDDETISIREFLERMTFYQNTLKYMTDYLEGKITEEKEKDYRKRRIEFTNSTDTLFNLSRENKKYLLNAFHTGFYPMDPLMGMTIGKTVVIDSDVDSSLNDVIRFKTYAWQESATRMTIDRCKELIADNKAMFVEITDNYDERIITTAKFDELTAHYGGYRNPELYERWKTLIDQYDFGVDPESEEAELSDDQESEEGLWQFRIFDGFIDGVYTLCIAEGEIETSAGYRRTSGKFNIIRTADDNIRRMEFFLERPDDSRLPEGPYLWGYIKREFLPKLVVPENVDAVRIYDGDDPTEFTTAEFLNAYDAIAEYENDPVFKEKREVRKYLGRLTDRTREKLEKTIKNELYTLCHALTDLYTDNGVRCADSIEIVPVRIDDKNNMVLYPYRPGDEMLPTEEEDLLWEAIPTTFFTDQFDPESVDLIRLEAEGTTYVFEPGLFAGLIRFYM